MKKRKMGSPCLILLLGTFQPSGGWEDLYALGCDAKPCEPHPLTATSSFNGPLI